MVREGGVRRGRGRKDHSDNGTPILDARFLPNLKTLPFARDLLGGCIGGRDISARKLAALFELPTQFEFWRHQGGSRIAQCA
jgi:hypothetical protein